MQVVCVEPAVSFANSVVSVAGNDTLVFPHVDSCMSVTFMVPPDGLIGGHAAMMNHVDPFNMQPATNLRSIIDRMKSMLSGRTLARVVFVGNDDGSWDIGRLIEALRLDFGKPDLSCPLINSGMMVGNGVDVFFNNATMRLHVQGYAYQKGRGDLGVPILRAAALDVPYHAIRDKDL